MTDPEPVRKTPLAAKLGMGVVALAATGGYVIVVGPEFSCEAGIPLHAGCALFLVLLWAAAFRGPLKNWKVAAGLAMAGFGLIVAGALNTDRYEKDLRAQLVKIRRDRLNVGPEMRVYDNQDPFGQEIEKAFGYSHNNSRTPLSQAPDWKRRPAMAKLIEDRSPGWPRALYGFVSTFVVDIPHEQWDEYSYGKEPRLACGHHYSRVLPLTSFRWHADALRAEQRLMAKAERDRELFLAGWKKLSAEERGEEIGK